MEFKNSLQEQLGEHEPDQVDELILDELFKNVDGFNTEHRKTLELYKNLEHLSLNGFGLKSLNNFPSLPNLRILEIRENLLNGSDLGILKTLYPKLYKLKLGGNPIPSVDNLRVLESFGDLKKLEVLDCKLTGRETYREELFKLLKNVQIIDKMDRNGDEIDSTIYEDDEDMEFEDGEGDFEDEDDFEDDEGDFDAEEEEEEEEDIQPAGKKKRRE